MVKNDIELQSLINNMIKHTYWIILILFSLNTQAQYKPDVIIIGGSAAGTAAAIQAARSGVKALLIEPSSNLIGDNEPRMDIPSYDMGLFKEWRDLFYKMNDSARTTPQLVLEKIVTATNNLSFLKNTTINNISQKKYGWEVEIVINGKKEDIRCKVLVDATTNSSTSVVNEFNLLNLDKNGKFITLVNYNKDKITNAYQDIQKLYRTSGAAGFGKDSTLHYFPLGVFIPTEAENLLVVSMSAFKDFDTEDFRNLALWTNIGQAVGALSAYGPFFNTSPSKANIRITQGEMFTYKSFLYPVLDIKTTDYAWYPVQKIIASGVLKFDFKTGFFNGNEFVRTNDIKAVLTDLYPRSRIWFIENKVDVITVENLVSLISFVSGRDPIGIKQEFEADWKTKYNFNSNYQSNKNISKLEFAILVDGYLAPFNVNVDFNGYFLR
jgi:hypothetical protein